MGDLFKYECVCERSLISESLIPFLQRRGIERGPDMRTLVKINFPNARTLQELEEDLCIECTSSASQHGLSWSRGTFHLRQRRMELEDLHENNIDEQAREELVRLKEGEKAY